MTDQLPTPAIGNKTHLPTSFCFPQCEFGKTVVQQVVVASDHTFRFTCVTA